MEELDTIGTIINMALKTEDENRKFPRMPIHAKAIIETEGQTIECEIDNLCLNGAFVKSDEHLAISSTVLLTIFDDSTSKVISDLKAKIVTVTKIGMGIQCKSACNNDPPTAIIGVQN